MSEKQAVIHFYSVSDSYGEFSNFAPYPIRMNNKMWPTSEHYFQAQKYQDNAHQEEIRNSKSPMIAARMGRSRKRPLRQDWEAVKVQVMREAVLAKFTQHNNLRTLLLSTGDAVLVEHTKNDSYWGDGGDGSGKNMLGRILMDIREQLGADCSHQDSGQVELQSESSDRAWSREPPAIQPGASETLQNSGVNQMTRVEWMNSVNSEEMVEACRASTGNRKLRLFAAACFRRLEQFLTDERQKAAIRALEDCYHEIPQGVVTRCRQAIPAPRESLDGKSAGVGAPYFVALMLYRELVSSSTGHHAAFAARGVANCATERVFQCKLLRCIVGMPPFGERFIPSEWRTDRVNELAQTVHDTQCFGLLPQLAIELETSGCDDVEMLSHCRSSDLHGHGCWVIDALIGAR